MPNTTEKMPWQEFRDNELALWTLELDELFGFFKANKSGMDQFIQISKFFIEGHSTEIWKTLLTLGTALDS